MEIKLDVNMTKDILTKGIRFHRETNLDSEACKKIKELTELFASVILELNIVKSHTLDEPYNLSGKEIREHIDEFLKSVEIETKGFEEE
ncbi:hypothetical protein [Staphylococcus hominis]|uniref:hypothetical protein n=1 Tax=Staphylococcus hominis TaxID=1290 RepID=UPI001F5A0675|nr:hypothetical protein [Staphylococcus hominis]MCI2931360.1 hypothetical protein [Staphylococcus hominis]